LLRRKLERRLVAAAVCGSRHFLETGTNESMDVSSTLLIFVSMFTNEPEGGIQAFHLDARSGAVKAASTTRGFANSFFLATSPDQRFLYALAAGKFGDAATEQVTAWRIAGRDGALEPLGRRPGGGQATCFVAPSAPGGPLLIAHYSSGTVATLPLAADGTLAADPVTVAHTRAASKVTARQEARHPHAIVPAPLTAGHPQFVYSTDLGCDSIHVYRLDAAGRLVAADPLVVPTPPGAGPRHLAFHPDGKRLYVINELANTVGVYDFDAASGQLTERQMIPTLPADFSGPSFTADLKITPDGRFLYGTNRGHDSLAAYTVAADGRLTLVEIVPSRGKGPQNIAITPDGSLLLCVNMPGNSLAVFRIDRDTGRLTPMGEPLAVQAPSSIAIVP
jgi:6-phosphogluconolactonase